MPLTNQEQKRYNRHIILHDIRIQGQEKIKETSILVVGAGGLGSPILYYLTAAGVGHIGIMDDDVVSESNLQRQILYDTTHVGTPKVTVATTKLKQLNPFTRITPYFTRLSLDNALEIISKYDIVMDATDNLHARYLINDACVKLGKPFTAAYASSAGKCPCSITRTAPLTGTFSSTMTRSRISRNRWVLSGHYRELSVPFKRTRQLKSYWRNPAYYPGNY